MTTTPTTVATAEAPPTTRAGRPPSSLRFDWLMLAVSFWPLAGALSDTFAHSNFPKLETFFTPWHALLYSGLAAVTTCNVLVMRHNHALGFPWRRAIAPGYELSNLGVAVLFVGGAIDLVWHTLFGIERDLEATVSPSHLLIQAGILLILAGPLRSAFARRESLRGTQQLPLVLSISFIYVMVILITQYAQPLTFRYVTGNFDFFTNPPTPVGPFLPQSIGLASFLVQSAIFMGLLLVVVRRWHLFPGALTIFFTLPALALSGINQDFSLLPVGIVGGIVADLLNQVLRPNRGNIVAVRAFAFLVPIAYFGAYYANLAILGQPITWKIHLWLGSILIAGIVGWALTYLMLPPGGATSDATAPERAPALQERSPSDI
jgi:hypothetical protein